MTSKPLLRAVLRLPKKEREQYEAAIHANPALSEKERMALVEQIKLHALR